jgi:SPP1 gp7 family putative phage head morphogenesis protein
MPIGLSFETPPLDAIAHHEAKHPELHFDYDEIMHEAHHKAFTVAKVVNLDLLGDIQESLYKAQVEGKSFEHWKKDLTPTLKSYGWYGKTEVVNPLTGEIKNIDVNSRRLKVIFETNMRTANAVGRYKSQMMSDAEYLRYSALIDARTRPSHSSKHGIILPKTDPWWNKNYPPNGWNCRCKAQAITSSQIEQKGLKVTSSAPADIADKDWAYHVGKADNTMKLYKEKIDALKCKESNAREKTVGCGFTEVAKKQYEKDVITLAKRVAIYKGIKELFETKEKRKVELCESNIFGENKKILLSSDTIQSHTHHPEVGAFEYSLIPSMLNGRVFIQKENVFVIVKKLGRYYRLALKNVKNTDEIFVVSLLVFTNYEKEIRKLSKYKEIEQ